MNPLTNWLKKLAANTPRPTTFNVVDPTSPNREVRALILTVLPPTAEDTQAIVSVYWKDSGQKVYEKRFDIVDKAVEVYMLHKLSLEQVQTFTDEQKYVEAKQAMERFMDNCKSTSDDLTQAPDTPITTTMAAQAAILSKTAYTYGAAHIVLDSQTNKWRIMSGDAILSESFDNVPSAKQWLDSNPTYKTEDGLQAEASTKEAKVTMQNIFFSTPDEAIEFQRKMKELQGPEESTSLDELEQKTLSQPNLGEPSLSYEDAEDQEIKEEQTISDQIKDEVKDQIESSLEEKRQTKFTPADETLVEAFRGVGRQWTEISDYLVRDLRYDKYDVRIFIDYMRNKEEGPKKDTLSKEPPKDLPLVEDVSEEALPTPPLEKETAIVRKAVDPIDELSPTDPSDIPPLPSTIPSAPDPVAIEKVELTEGDWVNVLSDVQTGAPGFAGTYIAMFSRKGKDYAIVEKEDGEFEEVSKHLVVKASLQKAADVPQKTTPKKHKITPDHVSPEEALPATPEIEETYRAIQTAENNIDTIKTLINQAQLKFEAEKKHIEETGGRIENEAALTDRIERLAALVEATETKLVSLGDTLVHLKQEQRDIPVKWSDKDKLVRIYKKFPETQKYIEHALNAAQRLSTTESIRELIFFPKKKLSKLDRTATPVDNLTAIDSSLTSALENILSLLR